MKKIVGVVAIVAGLLMLSGFSEAGSGSTGVSLVGGAYTVNHIQVDGRDIACVMTSNGGVSCDWSK